MTLLRDIKDFFQRERLWSLLLIFILIVFAYIFSHPSRQKEAAGSEVIEQLRLAESRLKEEIQATGGVQKYLTARPQLLWTFSFFTSLILVIFLLGFIFDFLWLFRPHWRHKLQSATGPPEAHSWGLGTVFKTILLFILATVALSLVLSLLKSLFFRSSSGNFLILIHTTLSDLLIIALVVVYIRRGGGNWRDLGFRVVQLWRDFWIGLAGYAAIFPLFVLVLVGLVLAVQFFAYEPPPHPLVEILLEEEKRAPWLIVYSVFLACVAGPFLEEIFFRGFCYPALKKRWGVGWALVLSSTFFSLIHQNLFAFLPVFVLGLGLGYLYEKRGTLVPSIVLHIVHNSVFISYFFLAKEVLKGIS